MEESAQPLSTHRIHVLRRISFFLRQFIVQKDSGSPGRRLSFSFLTRPSGLIAFFNGILPLGSFFEDRLRDAKWDLRQGDFTSILEMRTTKSEVIPPVSAADGMPTHISVNR